MKIKFDKETIDAIKATLTIDDCVNHLVRIKKDMEENKNNPEWTQNDTSECLDEIEHYQACIKVLEKSFHYEGKIKTGYTDSCMRSANCPFEFGYIEIIIDGKKYKCFTDDQHKFKNHKEYTIKCTISPKSMTVSRVTIIE